MFKVKPRVMFPLLIVKETTQFVALITVLDNLPVGLAEKHSCVHTLKEYSGGFTSSMYPHWLWSFAFLWISLYIWHYTLHYKCCIHFPENTANEMFSTHMDATLGILVLQLLTAMPRMWSIVHKLVNLNTCQPGMEVVTAVDMRAHRTLRFGVLLLSLVTTNPISTGQRDDLDKSSIL